MRDIFDMKGADFASIRKESGYDKDELALLIYNDDTKEARIEEVERGVTQPLFNEALGWLKYCAVGKDRSKVLRAIRELDQFVSEHIKKQ